MDKVFGQKHKHENKDGLCYLCNNIKFGEINLFKISNRIYGSIFQGDSFTIQLCEDCKMFVNPMWFDNNKTINESGYKYENFIETLIDMFPIENQEYVKNCTNHLHPPIDREDWILENK